MEFREFTKSVKYRRPEETPYLIPPNNPLLAGIFYFANYIQKAGSGIIEMIKQCKSQGLPEPEFVSIRGSEFRTIIGRDIFTESVLRKLGLNERQLKAIKYIKKRQATDDLKALEDRSIFERIGITGKGTYYILKGH